MLATAHLMVHGNTWCLLDALGHFLVGADISWWHSDVCWKFLLVWVVCSLFLVVSRGLLVVPGDGLRMRSSIRAMDAGAFKGVDVSIGSLKSYEPPAPVVCSGLGECAVYPLAVRTPSGARVALNW